MEPSAGVQEEHSREGRASKYKRSEAGQSQRGTGLWAWWAVRGIEARGRAALGRAGLGFRSIEQHAEADEQHGLMPDVKVPSGHRRGPCCQPEQTGRRDRCSVRPWVVPSGGKEVRGDRAGHGLRIEPAGCADGKTAKMKKKERNQQ